MTANPLPPLTPEEYEALKADIALRGVIVPILLDVHGNVIDGHHRRQIARELGEHIICPEETLECTEEEARDLAVVLNTHRRQLSRDQRREAVAQLVKLGPARSNRQIARDAGVDHQTVAAVRGSLEATGEVPQLDRTVGADGKERPARRAEPVPEPEVIGGQPLAPREHDPAAERIRQIEAEHDEAGAPLRHFWAFVTAASRLRVCADAAGEAIRSLPPEDRARALDSLGRAAQAAAELQAIAAKPARLEAV